MKQNTRQSDKKKKDKERKKKGGKRNVRVNMRDKGKVT